MADRLLLINRLLRRFGLRSIAFGCYPVCYALPCLRLMGVHDDAVGRSVK